MRIIAALAVLGVVLAGCGEEAEAAPARRARPNRRRQPRAPRLAAADQHAHTR